MSAYYQQVFSNTMFPECVDEGQVENNVGIHCKLVPRLIKSTLEIKLFPA